ncbi:hypothetical protein RIF29_06016 [Crotalaria pallida]|uniref:RRM domain-containing protein n=1 Tax=Crotalaria pallida TaxID=3830 RepID=A0AAN9J2Q4_CROPI
MRPGLGVVTTGRGTREERFNKGLHGGTFKDATTFYVTNFPENLSTYELWRSFQQWGRVVDVFAPEKRNRSGKRFAFIRYSDVVFEKELKRKLDNAFIGGQRIFANIAKYSRNEEVRKNEEVRRNDMRSRRGGEQATILGERRHIISYAQVVGNVWDKEKLGELKQTLEREGLSTIEVIPMGKDFVLLKPREGEEVLEILKDAGEGFQQLFESIVRWTEDFVIGYRSTWISCADECTRLRTRLDVAMVRLKNSSLNPICTTVRIQINGKIFAIRLMEECFVERNVTLEAGNHDEENIDDEEENVEEEDYVDAMEFDENSMPSIEDLLSKFSGEEQSEPEEGEVEEEGMGHPLQNKEREDEYRSVAHIETIDPDQEGALVIQQINELGVDFPQNRTEEVLSSQSSATTTSKEVEGRGKKKQKKQKKKKESKKNQKKLKFRAWKDFWIELREFQGGGKQQGSKALSVKEDQYEID